MKIQMSGRDGRNREAILDKWIWDEIVKRCGYVPRLSMNHGYGQIWFECKLRRLHHAVWFVKCDTEGVHRPNFRSIEPNDPVVNHKNYNRLDNRLFNLEVITRSANCAHGQKNRSYEMFICNGGTLYERKTHRGKPCEGRWIAEIKHNGKRYMKGSMDKSFLEKWLRDMNDLLLKGGDIEAHLKPRKFKGLPKGGIYKTATSFQAKIKWQRKNYTFTGPYDECEGWLKQKRAELSAAMNKDLPIPASNEPQS